VTPPPASAGERPGDGGELGCRLRGRVQMVLTCSDMAPDPKPLVDLHLMVCDQLGPTSSLALLVEYNLEELRSRSRSVAESARVWEELHARADAVLDGRDTTLMSIKALHARYVRLSGGPADRDAAVQSYEVEWRRRLAMLGAMAHRTSTAHANFAIALRDHGGWENLRRACRIAREEVAVRQEVWGTDHSFTWIAQAILAQTLLRAAERAYPVGPGEVFAVDRSSTTALAAMSDTSSAAEGADSVRRGGASAAVPADPGGWQAAHGRYPVVAEEDLTRPRHELVTEALALAAAVLAARRGRFGATAAATLRIQLVHAHALLLGGEPSPAATEIRYVLATNRRVGADLDPGWPELLLARALLAAAPREDGEGLSEALRQARAAVEARRGRYPAEAAHVAEAEHFERAARRLAARQPSGIPTPRGETGNESAGWTDDRPPLPPRPPQE